MQTTVQKWGNSLAVRIPVSFVKEAGFNNGSDIDISMDSNSGNIIIKPLRKKYLLTDLQQKIDHSNLHQEVQTGESTGNEIW